MPEVTLEIVNEKGMHARAAAVFTRLAAKFQAGVWVQREGEPDEDGIQAEVNGKSIMGVLMLAAYCGSTIRIRAEGEDADRALTELRELVENGFGEDD